MKLTFLGTGGSRFVLIDQLRATGGFVLEMGGEMLHIDPGPGSLVRAKEFGVDLKKVTGLLVSHAHPDHCTDVEVVVEAMTSGGLKKRGVLIGNKYVIKGGSNYKPSLSPYHLEKLERFEILKPGEKTKIGKVEITATKTKHADSEAIGFVFSGSKKIGYTSDGEYFKGQEKYFKNCDYLVLNCLRPRTKTWPEHMNVEQAVELIKKTKPKTAILKHFGIPMLKAGPEKEAKWIEEKTGVKTIAAKDGMVVGD